MSVHGEFERYARALAHALRDGDEPAHAAQAREIERRALALDQPLETRAESLLALDLPARAMRDAWPADAADTCDSLMDICRIVLGR